MDIISLLLICHQEIHSEKFTLPLHVSIFHPPVVESLKIGARIFLIYFGQCL